MVFLWILVAAVIVYTKRCYYRAAGRGRNC